MRFQVRFRISFFAISFGTCQKFRDFGNLKSQLIPGGTAMEEYHQNLFILKHLESTARPKNVTEVGFEPTPPKRLEP